MTAILLPDVPGRLCREFGTMMVNEEVDALQTMDLIRSVLWLCQVWRHYCRSGSDDLCRFFRHYRVGSLESQAGLTIKTYITHSIKTIQVFVIVTSLIKWCIPPDCCRRLQKGFSRAGAQDVASNIVGSCPPRFSDCCCDSIFDFMFYI
jgi:phospholipid/cholesterol/gamma-HCH transport system permease protein